MTTTLRWTALGLSLCLLAAPARADVSALLRVARSAPSATGEEAFDAVEFRTLMTTVVALARTRVVLERALKSEGIADLALVKEQPDPTTWLWQHTAALNLPDNELLELQLDANGEEAEKLLDAVAAALLEQVNGPAVEQQSEVVVSLRKRLDEAVEKWKQKQDTYQRLARDVGALDRETATIRSKLLFDQLARHQREVVEAASQIQKLRLNLAENERALRAAREKAPSDDEIETALRQHPEASQTQMLRDHIALELAQIGKQGDAHTQLYRQTELQLQRAEDELRAARDKHREAALSKLRQEAVAPLEFNRQSLQASIDSYQQQVDQSKIEAEKLKQEINQLTHVSSDLEALAAEARREKAAVEELRQLVTAAEAQAVQPPRVTLLQAAAPVLSPAKD